MRVFVRDTGGRCLVDSTQKMFEYMCLLTQKLDSCMQNRKENIFDKKMRHHPDESTSVLNTTSTTSSNMLSPMAPEVRALSKGSRALKPSHKGKRMREAAAEERTRRVTCDDSRSNRRTLQAEKQFSNQILEIWRLKSSHSSITKHSNLREFG